MPPNTEVLDLYSSVPLWDKDGSPSHSKGMLALSLNLDTLFPKMGTKSPAHPHRQHNSSVAGLPH